MLVEKKITLLHFEIIHHILTHQYIIAIVDRCQIMYLI